MFDLSVGPEGKLRAEGSHHTLHQKYSPAPALYLQCDQQCTI